MMPKVLYNLIVVLVLNILRPLFKKIKFSKE